MRALIYLRDRRLSSPSLLWPLLGVNNFFPCSYPWMIITIPSLCCVKKCQLTGDRAVFGQFSRVKMAARCLKLWVSRWSAYLKRFEVMLLRGYLLGFGQFCCTSPCVPGRDGSGMNRNVSTKLWNDVAGLYELPIKSWWDRRTIRRSPWGWNATKTA